MRAVSLPRRLTGTARTGRPMTRDKRLRFQPRILLKIFFDGFGYNIFYGIEIHDDNRALRKRLNEAAARVEFSKNSARRPFSAASLTLQITFAELRGRTAG